MTSVNDTETPTIKTTSATIPDEGVKITGTREKSSSNTQCHGNTQPDTRPPSSPHTERQSAGDPQNSSPPATPVTSSTDQSHVRRRESSSAATHGTSPTAVRAGVSEWSHQQIVVQPDEEEDAQEKELEWQVMPAYAPFDIYDDDGKLIAREAPEEIEAPPGYDNLMGGPAKGYSRVVDDEDAKSTTSLDENTSYLFKDPTNRLDEEDDDARDVLAQMQMTKNLLSDNQRIAYVGIVKLATAAMGKEVAAIERTKGSKKQVDLASEALQLWGQKMMVRLYGHMELETAEQVMIEQLAEHGLETKDLTPSLMTTSKVKNPAMDTKSSEDMNGTAGQPKISLDEKKSSSASRDEPSTSEAPPPVYKEDADEDDGDVPQLQDMSALAKQEDLDIDLRWTVLCDLFLILIRDSIYDARSRCLLEKVAGYLDVSWIDVCRFEKRVTEALEMEEAAERDELDESKNMEKRRKRARNRRLAMMGLATVGGGLVIGLSAGLLAPVIGAGLAAGFTTIGVTGTSTFLAGAGGAAVIGSAATVAGGTVGVRAANRRTGAVKTFEYRPLHNNKRVNLIITVAGWMNGKVDDVRLPFSTVDPLMGDVYSIYWEPEMLRSMGDTINILATEALTQGLQQILGSTLLIALMAALQLPIVLSKLSYLIDNPWSVSIARADAAGLILADSLTERNLGSRPITLVGFSLGSRVIFSCLKELANKGALGLIQNVYIFGTPVVVKKDEYLRAKTVVSGRFVNGYATNDWILGYLFRATGGGISRVAGLAKVEIPGIENFDVTAEVPGHMAYRKSIPKLLRMLDWAVTSDEFDEIEDPDPDNHEKRQRELINEIEEARLELQAKPEKRRFGIFSRNKKRALKKDWEMYDESIKHGDADVGGDPNGPLFDIEAIKREAIELAAEGIEIKQLESTMPPIKIDSLVLTPPLRTSEGGSPRPATPKIVTTNSAVNSKPVTPAITGLGMSTVSASTMQTNGLHIRTNPSEVPRNSYFGEDDIKSPSDQLSFAQDEIELTFEPARSRPPSLPPKPVAGPSRSPSPRPTYTVFGPEYPKYGSNPNLASPSTQGLASPVLLPPNRPYTPSRSPSPKRRPDLDRQLTYGRAKDVVSPENGASTAGPPKLNSNPWADEDDEFSGHEKEMSMTFE